MARKTRKPDAQRDDDADPLGKRIDCYHVSLGGVLLVGGVIALVGLGLTIHADDGRSIRLPPMCFKIVSNPKKLIQQIKMRAGV